MKKEGQEGEFKEILANIANIFERQGLSLGERIKSHISEKKLDIGGILREVREFSEKFPPESEGIAIHYIEICGQCIPLGEIRTWKRDRKYSFRLNRYVYLLSINSGKVILEFPDEGAREEAFAKIRDAKIMSQKMNLV